MRVDINLAERLRTAKRPACRRKVESTKASPEGQQSARLVQILFDGPLTYTQIAKTNRVTHNYMARVAFKYGIHRRKKQTPSRRQER